MRAVAPAPALLFLALCACTPSGTPPDGAPAESAVAPGDAPATPSPAPGAWFVDVTDAWGLDFAHEAGFTEEKHLPETMGAGAALSDLDGDGLLDLYLVQGGPLPLGEHAQRDERVPPNETWLGAGGGRLRDATAASGDGADRGYGMGVACGDVDGDGDEDLVVTNLGPDRLLLNDGAARFANPEDNGGLADDRWTAGAVLFDGDADGDLDLYVTGYLEVDLEDPVWCGRRQPGWRSYCHPDRYEGLPDRYWRNRGDGSFEDATAAAGLADSAGKGLGALAADLDLDGDVDVYVANDSTENRFWRNRGDGTFVDDTLLTGTGVNADGRTEAGMGLAAADVDADGDLDLLVTNLDKESNTLYRNEGGGLYGDATIASGLEGPSRPHVGFGVLLEDFDRDGDADLAVANGHIIDNIALYDGDQTWAQRAQLFVNDGSGRFREDPIAGGALVARPFVARGLYAGDLDGDGRVDLVLTQCGGPARLFRNVVPDVDPPPGELLLPDPAPGSWWVVETESGRRVAYGAGGTSSYFGRSARAVRLTWSPADPPRSILEGVPGAPPRELWPLAGPSAR